MLPQALPRGEALFNGTCSVCHQSTDVGIANVFPPLASSDFPNSDSARAIGIVLNGLSGPIAMDDRENYAVLMRIAMLSSLAADNVTSSLGFRCARDLPVLASTHRNGQAK